MSKSLNKLVESKASVLLSTELKDGEYYVGTGGCTLARWSDTLKCFFYLAKAEDGTYFAKPINHADNEDGTGIYFKPLSSLNISS